MRCAAFADELVGRGGEGVIGPPVCTLGVLVGRADMDVAVSRPFDDGCAFGCNAVPRPFLDTLRVLGMEPAYTCDWRNALATGKRRKERGTTTERQGQEFWGHCPFMFAMLLRQVLWWR